MIKSLNLTFLKTLIDFDYILVKNSTYKNNNWKHKIFSVNILELNKDFKLFLYALKRIKKNYNFIIFVESNFLVEIINKFLKDINFDSNVIVTTVLPTINKNSKKNNILIFLGNFPKLVENSTIKLFCNLNYSFVLKVNLNTNYRFSGLYKLTTYPDTIKKILFFLLVLQKNTSN